MNDIWAVDDEGVEELVRALILGFGLRGGLAQIICLLLTRIWT
jgi:hypothetical protein